MQVWCINATKGVAAGQAPLATDDGGVFALSWVVKPGSQTLRCSAGAIDDPALYAEVSPQGNIDPSTPVLSVDPPQATWTQPPLDPDTPDSAPQTTWWWTRDGVVIPASELQDDGKRVPATLTSKGGFWSAHA